MQTEQEVLDAIDGSRADRGNTKTPAAGIAGVPPPEKKRPGRPKKEVPVVPVESHGISETPLDAKNVLELTYSNPRMFKKLIQLYKQFQVGEIEMNFDKAGLKITTLDHTGKSTIYTTIDGRCMNHYYCKNPISICVSRESLERVLGTLGKNHYSIKIVLGEDHRSSMYITVNDIEYDSSDTYNIDVMCRSPDGAAPGESHRDDDTNYPIKFSMSFQHFKTRIKNIKKLSPFIIIQKDGNKNLQITYDGPQQVNFVGEYKDGAKIGLESRLADNDAINVSVCIDYIRPFSNSDIGDKVFIAADKYSKISFMTRLDKKDIGWSCYVKVFTEIKGYRPPAADD